MPTGLGLIFLILTLYCFYKSSSHLFALMAFSGIFQAATVVSGISVPPYYLVAVFFVIRCIFETVLGGKSGPPIKGLLPLLAFGGLGVLSAFIYPHLFSGMPVYDPRYGLDDQIFYQPPLQFNGANRYQACLLIANVCVVWAAAVVPGKVEPAVRRFSAAYVSLVCLIILQLACLLVGWKLPISFLNNDQNYALSSISLGMSRPSGTFVEPSMAATILVGATLAALALYLNKGTGLVRIALPFAAVLLVASSASFLALAIGIVALFLAFPVFRFPYFVRLTRAKRLGILGLVGASGFLTLAIPAVRNTLADQVLNKGESDSFLVRTAADLHAFQLAYATHGIGVGLGSNRPSGLVAMLVSTMGIAGLVLFAMLIIRLFQNDLGEYSWLKWCTLGLVLDMAFGVSDLNFPMLWILFALVARAAQTTKPVAASGPSTLVLAVQP